MVLYNGNQVLSSVLRMMSTVRSLDLPTVEFFRAVTYSTLSRFIYVRNVKNCERMSH